MRTSVCIIQKIASHSSAGGGFQNLINLLRFIVSWQQPRRSIIWDWLAWITWSPKWFEVYLCFAQWKTLSVRRCTQTLNFCPFVLTRRMFVRANDLYIYINIYLLLGSLHYWRPPQRQDAPPKTLGWAGLNPQEDNMTVLDAKMAARAARGWSFLSKWSNVRADLRVTAIFDSILIRSGRDCARQWGWLGQSGRIKERNRTWRFGDDIINIIHQLFQFKTSTGK